MSDTDDTDALLTCDPGGGLDHLLEKTMDGLSNTQLDTSVNTSTDKNTSTDSPSILKSPPGSSCCSGGGSKKTRKKKNAKLRKAKEKALNELKESSFEVSDFFNSENELVLTGLPKVSGVSDCSGGTNCSHSRSTSNSDNGSRSSSNCSGSTGTQDDTTENSTVIPLNRKNATGSCASACKEGHSHKITNTEQTSSSCSNVASTSSSALVRVSPSSVPTDIQADLKRQILEANKNNPEVEEMLEGNSTKIAYGVMNLNLNDLSTFAGVLSRTNIFPTAKTRNEENMSNTFVPSRNSDGEQVFTRAPNFRTPGGYKPPQNPRKCRELTDEQIREEVRKMYAFPFVEDIDEEDTKTAKSKPSLDKVTEESETIADPKKTETEDEVKDKLKVQFNFLEGSSVPNEFGKGKSGKPIKRKLIPHGGALCGSTKESIPDLGFGVRDEMNPDMEEVSEPQIKSKTAYSTGSKPNEEEEKVSESNKNSSNPSSLTESSKPRFSFGFGEEENMLSPIRPSVIQSASGSSRVGGSGSQLEVSHLNRFQPSPRKIPVPNLIPDSSSTASTTDKDKSTSETETEKKQLNLSSSSPILVSSVVTVHPTTSALLGVSKKLTSPKKRLIRKAATKYRAMTSPRYRQCEEESHEEGSVNGDSSSCPSHPVPMNSLASDLEKILSEIDLPPEEIESLIQNFDEDEHDFSDVGLLDDPNLALADGNLISGVQGALQELNLEGVWKRDKDELGTGTDSYFAEKFKREQCEKELRQLQESFLSQRQQNAVLEGTLKRRNMMLVQITMAFNRVCKEWKKFDAENKDAVGKLQRHQKLLVAACKHSKERISQYEKELHKTLELAESFKTKVCDVQKERDESVLVLKDINREMELNVFKLKEELSTVTNEREATLRALRESQVKLDEGRTKMEEMEEELRELRAKDTESGRKYEELLQAKAQQDRNYLDVMERRNELEALVMKLTTDLNIEKSGKDQMRREMQDEAERKTRAEAERLHEYYNKKVQEILKSATEEAARAESMLKEQMKRAAQDSERKISECKEKYLREIETLRAKYDAEIEKLKRENLHRQLLISSTVKQLQLGESSNLDMNALTVTQAQPRSQTQRHDLFESLKSSKCPEAETVFKTNNSTSLTKFTLDHLPGLLPSSKLQDDLNCNTGGAAFARFKTSTPMMTVDPNGEGGGKSLAISGGGDYRKHRPCPGNDLSFNSYLQLEKVCSEKSKSGSVTSSSCEGSDLKNVLSHLLEAPVKPEPEREQGQGPGTLLNMNNPVPPPLPQLDPTLQKCIQDLLRSYADKFQPNGRNNGGGGMGLTQPPLHISSLIPNTNVVNLRNNDNFPMNSNKSDVESCNNNVGVLEGNGEEKYGSGRDPSHPQQHRQQQHQPDCRSENRKMKGNSNTNPKGQGHQQLSNQFPSNSASSSQNKPPWK